MSGVRPSTCDSELGQQAEEELEAVDYHRYDRKYGRVLLAYQILEDELLLLVIVQISLRIQRISMQSP